jgi:hypothetical protein
MSDDELDSLIRQLEGLLTQITVVRRRRESEGLLSPISVGNRVRITNRVRRPSGWAPAAHDGVDQIGTVTRVTSSRVYITTDSGIQTWRAPSNVVKIA